MQVVEKKIAALMLTYPKPSGLVLGYGTAGFRAYADTLPWIMIRIGLLASLRSKQTRKCIGVMITASHNPERDNGVKLIDPHGEMLDPSWEVYANQMSSFDDDIGTLWQYLEDLMTQFNIQPQDEATVAIAFDTRKSSQLLASIVKKAAQAFSTIILDFELMTTPQLHYAVRCFNDGGVYGHYTEAGYFDKLCVSFQSLTETVTVSERNQYLAIDAANGVGAFKLAYIRDKLSKFVPIHIYNDGSSGRLNEKCGADYVKLNQCPPDGVPLEKYVKCCSIDGDADRLLYFFNDRNRTFRILDGDRFSVLFALFISVKLKEAKLDEKVRIGVIQTAYANGSSTKYLTEIMKVEVICVPTGVKHLHHKALNYDVGIYFEANGHGTIVFSKNFKSELKKNLEDSSRNQAQQRALRQLHGFVNVINETVGDAIADLLATEAILLIMNLTLDDWLKLYQDLPQRQLKVFVRDRNMIETTDAERKCVKPACLQERIDQVVSRYSMARAFVRPSGTEDIVRVYAEATTQLEADQLANEVQNLVEEFTK